MVVGGGVFLQLSGYLTVVTLWGRHYEKSCIKKSCRFYTKKKKKDPFWLQRHCNINTKTAFIIVTIIIKGPYKNSKTNARVRESFWACQNKQSPTQYQSQAEKSWEIKHHMFCFKSKPRPVYSLRVVRRIKKSKNLSSRTITQQQCHSCSKLKENRVPYKSWRSFLL